MASEEEVESPPGSSQMVMTLANKTGMNPTAAFRELLDNSLDAGAKAVIFRYFRGRRRLEIEDGGRGTTNVKAIVTPFQHHRHQTTESGRFGIGGSAALIFLTGGTGGVSVGSVTDKFVSTVKVDYREIIARDRFVVIVSPQEANDGRATGTLIGVTGCMELNRNHVGSIQRELVFDFAPAMRRGVKVAFEVDGKGQDWEPYRAPALSHRTAIDVEVDGHRVRGFCGLTKPGEPNSVRGWAVGYAHRFLGVFRAPLGDRSADLGRFYSEVMLPRQWPNISDHKDSFVTDPVELWDKLGEACAAVLDMAEQESRTLELDAATATAQELLDRVTGHGGGGIKGRRPGGGEKNGAVTPTGNGTPHQQFTAWQPGDKGAAKGGLPNRIKIQWTSNMPLPYTVNPEGRAVIVQLSLDDPANEKYHGAGSGLFLADMTLAFVACDSKGRPGTYRTLFPNMDSEEIAERFKSLRERLRTPAETPVGAN